MGERRGYTPREGEAPAGGQRESCKVVSVIHERTYRCREGGGQRRPGQHLSLRQKGKKKPTLMASGLASQELRESKGKREPPKLSQRGGGNLEKGKEKDQIYERVAQERKRGEGVQKNRTAPILGREMH